MLVFLLLGPGYVSSLLGPELCLLARVLSCFCGGSMVFLPLGPVRGFAVGAGAVFCQLGCGCFC